MPPLRALRYAWALPNTILGLVLGALSFVRPRVRHGVVVFAGPPRGALWFVKLFRRTAVTYGHVVLSTRPVEGRLLAHELHHVGQYERLGPLYIPVYVLIWLFRGYARHPFERAARRAESATPAEPSAARAGSRAGSSRRARRRRR